MLYSQSTVSFTNHNKVQLVKSGNDYFELLEKLILGAQHFIHLQTYIFKEDETGSRVAGLLMEAAKRHVQVYLVLDSYASQDISHDLTSKFSDAGIHFRWFDALLKSKYFYLGRRLHHKIVVVDGVHGLVGGINVSDHYNNTTEATAWLDYAVYVQGEAVAELQSICERRTVLNPGFFTRKKNVLTADKRNSLGQKSLVGVRVNDWVRQRKEITNMYLRMLQQAKSHVIIMSPYFIPGSKFMQALLKTAKRGVRVQLILTGVSDVKIAKLAERYIYKLVFAKNIEIYEYHKKVLHGKIGVCDNQWVTVGSYNINNISAYASIELNLEIMDGQFATDASRELTDVIKNDCKLITESAYDSHTSFFKRIQQRVAYDIFRLLFFLFTFYFKQHKE